MNLYGAVVNSGFIDHYQGESSLLEVIKSLPSCERWMQYVKVEPVPSAEIS